MMCVEISGPLQGVSVLCNVSHVTATVTSLYNDGLCMPISERSIEKLCRVQTDFLMPLLGCSDHSLIAAAKQESLYLRWPGVIIVATFHLYICSAFLAHFHHVMKLPAVQSD